MKSSAFMEPEVLLLCSQAPPIGTYHDLDKFSSRSFIILLRDQF
jgi:hypothetical protein